MYYHHSVKAIGSNSPNPSRNISIWLTLAHASNNTSTETSGFDKHKTHILSCIDSKEAKQFHQHSHQPEPNSQPTKTSSPRIPNIPSFA
jgi:hypothetical protein